MVGFSKVKNPDRRAWDGCEVHLISPTTLAFYEIKPLFLHPVIYPVLVENKNHSNEKD